MLSMCIVFTFLLCSEASLHGVLCVRRLSQNVIEISMQHTCIYMCVCNQISKCMQVIPFCFLVYILNYRIADNLRGYQYLWFSLIKRVPRTYIPTNLIPHACMLAKGCYSAKTFLKVFPRKFIPTKITRYKLSAYLVVSHCIRPQKKITCFSGPPLSFFRHGFVPFYCKWTVKIVKNH